MVNANSLRPFCDLSRKQLIQWCAAHKQPAYRARQIHHWLFQTRVCGFQAMQNLPVSLREQLQKTFAFFATTVVRHQKARDRTEKLLLQLEDGNHLECVLMREAERRTICLSTQVGCAMGCVFCASGVSGWKRDLSQSEILEQVLHLDRLLPIGERITNLVVMGIGEPLANLSALLPALELLHDAEGMGLGARRVTISTVGLPEKIRELAHVGQPYNLAVSLHAPNDRLRNELVPTNQQTGIPSILQAADEYFSQTGRRVSYEYVLLGGINDRPTHARQLVALLQNRNAHVNVIPMNGIDLLPFGQPDRPDTKRFTEILRQGGVNVTVRKRKGADIDAACGQLRLRVEQLGKSAT